MSAEHFPQAVLNEAPIELPQGQLVRNMADLEPLVEGPALPACLLLYDKNIRTISASANTKDTQEAYIDIDYSSLSPDNQRLALEVGSPIFYSPPNQVDGQAPDAVKLAVPLAPDDDSESTAGKLYALAEGLRSQPLLWAPTYSLDELKNLYEYDSSEEVTPVDFEQEGYYYDETSDTFHLSEELFNKAKTAHE